MTKKDLDNLRLELSVKSKNGIDFTLSAGILWILIAFIWSLNNKAHDKSILTFIAGPLLLPLAFLFSKIFKTEWTNKGNPLQPLGLLLNFAQFFYFPILIFTLIKLPDYFVMVYAIITGAHLFPYAWFYKSNSYAIFAGLISGGTLILGLNLSMEMLFLVPIFTCTSLLLLSMSLYFEVRGRQLTPGIS